MESRKRCQLMKSIGVSFNYSNNNTNTETKIITLN